MVAVAIPQLPRTGGAHPFEDEFPAGRSPLTDTRYVRDPSVDRRLQGEP
jgi:hypothetical protein